MVAPRKGAFCPVSACEFSALSAGSSRKVRICRTRKGAQFRGRARRRRAARAPKGCAAAPSKGRPKLDQQRSSVILPRPPSISAGRSIIKPCQGRGTEICFGTKSGGWMVNGDFGSPSPRTAPLSSPPPCGGQTHAFDESRPSRLSGGGAHSCRAFHSVVRADPHPKPLRGFSLPARGRRRVRGSTLLLRSRRFVFAGRLPGRRSRSGVHLPKLSIARAGISGDGPRVFFLSLPKDAQSRAPRGDG